MTAYYRVIKDNFLWEVGAIIQYNGNGAYSPIEDIWDMVKDQNECIIDDIVENMPEYFERVYQDSLKGNLYRTADQMKKMYKKAFKK
jgi:hypothetical protein